MKKLFFILACFLTAFILSCGSSSGTGESGKTCESNLDCPVGEICSSGTCVTKGSNGGGSGEGGEVTDDENGNGGTSDGTSDSTSDSDGETKDDSDDWVSPEDPSTGTCEPGKKQKCEYPGAEGTEDVGPCKAAVRTCKEDGTWGKCEGAVEPILENTNELCSNGIDDDCDGIIDNGIDNICKGGSAPSDDEEPEEDEEDDDSDVEHCDTVCSTLVEIENNGCLSPMVSEAEAGLCNGQDDDCDGKIDEGCPCQPGTTQKCFSGKPANRNVGICSDGEMTCKGKSMRAMTGDWGDSECVNDIKPSKKESCDKVDNNCNGCADEGLCCSPKIDCSYDIGTATPFVDKIIDGKNIYDPANEYQDADTVNWEWTLTKGPCDVVLNKTSFKTKGAKTQAELAGEGAESTVVSGVGLSQFKVNFQLSGTYNLHLKITRPGEDPYECDWQLRVVSNGLRVELCWDTTGKIDVDLHVGKNGVTDSWTDSSACFFDSCQTASYNVSDATFPYEVNWGYAATNSTTPNPRLDIDNITTTGKPENINIDNPNNNDTFRVLARYYGSHYDCNWLGYNCTDVATHPVVNIYCGGTRKATFGESPQVTIDSKNDSWKVVEVKWVGDPGSDACELTPNLGVSNGSVPSSYSSW